jgi:cobalt-zinc-cadmium efflux system membrane fusion protein
MKKIIIPIAIFLLVACGKSSAPQEQSASAQDTTATETQDTMQAAADTTAATVAADSQKVDAVTSATALPNHTSYNGTLIVPAQHHATVTVTMGGKVHHTSLIPGGYVHRGSIVATLENPAFIELQKDYLDAYAQLSYLESEYKRQQRLSTQEAASQKRMQEAKANYVSMKIRMDASAAQLRNLGLSTAYIVRHGIRSYMPVLAPINGFVSELNINIGKYVREGDPICEIFDKNFPMLCLTAHEKDLGDISVGNRVQFRVNGMGTRTFSAVVSSISQEVDKVNRSVEVYCRVKKNNPRFRPGMYVMARVEKR